MSIIQKILFFISHIFSKSQGQGEQNPVPTDDQNENEIIPETTDDTGEDQNVTDKVMPDYSKLMVHLDAGHGKATPGKRSPSTVTRKGYGSYTKEQLSVYEYEYNRMLVKNVDAKLKRLGFKTYIVTPEVEGDVGL